MPYPHMVLVQGAEDLAQFIEMICPDGADACRSLDMGSFEALCLDYQPDNGSRYLCVLTLSPFAQPQSCDLLSIPNFGRCMGVVPGSGKHWCYVAEKLALREPDARAIASLLNALYTGVNQ